MLKVAVLEPVAEGVKLTLMVQLPPGATLDPQVLVWANSLPLVPAIEIPVIVSAPVPLFVRVTLAAGLVPPIPCPAKLTVDPDKVTKEGWDADEDGELPPPHPIQESITKMLNIADASIRGGHDLIGTPIGLISTLY
jgi:hypothetical protein